MSNIKTGDIVEPTSPSLGLPRGSTWRVAARIGNDCELLPHNDCAVSFRQHVCGRRFSVDYLETVDLFRIDDKTVNFGDLMVADPVKDADKQVEQAAAALDAAKENARKAREEARAAAKAEAKRKAAIEAEKKALAKHKALSARLHADRCLGEATLALIAEVSRLHNGGAEQVAPSSIAMHAEQLQPLAKSYGYRIVKPSLLAQVVKL